MQDSITTYQQPNQPAWTPMPNVAYPTIQQQGTWTLKEKLIYSLLGLVIVGGTIYIGRKIILNRISNKEENNTFQEGNPATTAKEVKMAFENDGWPGTDTNALRTTLTQITSRDQFNKVMKSYQKLYNSNLLKDMSSELQTTEYNEMLEIIAAKPQKKGQVSPTVAYNAWAKRLKAAFDKTYGFLPGTDSDAIVAAFNEIPTQAAFVQVGVAYSKLYNKNLTDDLKSESEFGQYGDWMKIITSKPQN